MIKFIAHTIREFATPGPIKAESRDYSAAVQYAKALAERFGITLPAALGQVIRFDDAIRKVTQTQIGMASLVIEVKDETGSQPAEKK